MGKRYNEHIKQGNLGDIQQIFLYSARFPGHKFRNTMSRCRRLWTASDESRLDLFSEALRSDRLVGAGSKNKKTKPLCLVEFAELDAHNYSGKISWGFEIFAIDQVRVWMYSYS